MENFAGNDFLRDALLQLLRRHYEKGYRLSSPLEMTKLRRRWREEHGGEELRASDEAVREQISSLTICQNDMAYLIAQDVKDWLQFIITMYLGKSKAIFYDAFFNRYQRRLDKAHIFDERILEAVIRELFPKLYYGKAFFGKVQGAVPDIVSQEIRGIWGEETLWTYERLGDRLYIPLDKIKQSLGQNREFLWVAEETYTHVSRVHIDDEMKAQLQQEAERLSQQKSFFSIKDLPIGDVLAENDALETQTNSVLYDAVYAICLEGEFDRKGDTLTKRGAEHAQGNMAKKMSAMDRMREFCRSRDVCTLSEMQAFAKGFTQNIKQLVLRAAAKSMIRIEADRYVADRYVDFDVAGTDSAIDEMMVGEYLPLKNFVTFARFPPCRQPWNVFLLESYCRRFSSKFRFDVPYPNMQCAGTVIRKSCDMNYDELQADAVLRANIELERKAVGQFLYDAGYIGKIPIDRQLDAIIELAKARV